MYLKDKKTGDLVEIMDVAVLVDPSREEVEGRFHSGEEMQEVCSFAKAELEFPSGEALPACWQNAHYKH